MKMKSWQGSVATRIQIVFADFTGEGRGRDAKVSLDPSPYRLKFTQNLIQQPGLK